MTRLVNIGDSQGVIIPNDIVKQARLEGSSLEFQVLKEGVLIKPLRTNSRETWIKDIEDTIKRNEGKKDKALLVDFLNDSDLEDFEW